MSGPEVLSSVPVEVSFNPPFGPTADEDFFPASVDTDGYELAKRWESFLQHSSKIVDIVFNFLNQFADKVYLQYTLWLLINILWTVAVGVGHF